MTRYVEVADQIRAQINELGFNSLLPTEDQLARRFNVSRVTIRRALAVLESGGFVDRQRGRGTIVNPPKIERTLMPMQPIEVDLKGKGISLDTELYSVERCADIPEHVIEKLNAKDGLPIAMVTLVRSADDRIFSFDRRYIPDYVLDDVDLNEVGTTPAGILFNQKAPSPVTEHRMELEFVPASADEAKILRVTPGTLVVASTGIDYLEDGKPFSMSVMHYRVDRVRFSYSARYRPTKGK